MVNSRRDVDVPDLVARARDGSPRAVARLISLVENDSPALRAVAAALAPHGGHAQIVGLTGSPGVGKSTSTSAYVSALRAAGKRVGVLAVEVVIVSSISSITITGHSPMLPSAA